MTDKEKLELQVKVQPEVAECIAIFMRVFHHEGWIGESEPIQNLAYKISKVIVNAIGE